MSGLREYFEEFYERDHAVRNVGRFMMILSHLAKHTDYYDSELFGVSSQGGVFYMSPGLLRAAHWYFTALPSTAWGSDEVAVVRIKDWARRWTAENSAGDEESTAAE